MYMPDWGVILKDQIVTPKYTVHSFFIKNIFHEKMDLRRFYFHVTKWDNSFFLT